MYVGLLTGADKQINRSVIIALNNNTRHTQTGRDCMPWFQSFNCFFFTTGSRRSASKLNTHRKWCPGSIGDFDSWYLTMHYDEDIYYNRKNGVKTTAFIAYQLKWIRVPDVWRHWVFRLYRYTYAVNSIQTYVTLSWRLVLIEYNFRDDDLSFLNAQIPVRIVSMI